MAENKNRASWLVLPHCESRKPTGRGYVVRESADGERANDSFNYGDVVPVKVYSRKAPADKCADRMSNGTMEPAVCSRRFDRA